ARKRRTIGRRRRTELMFQVATLSGMDFGGFEAAGTYVPQEPGASPSRRVIEARGLLVRRASHGAAVGVPVRLHAAVEIGQRLAALVAERPPGEFQRDDAVHAERAKILAHLAPGDQRPDLSPEPQAERASAALGLLARFVGV